jgi:hypothetical protein
VETSTILRDVASGCTCLPQMRVAASWNGARRLVLLRALARLATVSTRPPATKLAGFAAGGDLMKRLLVLLLVFLTACTVLDGGDRDDLIDAIEKSPREDRDAMAMMIVGAKTRDYLRGRPPNSAAISLECRMVHPAMGAAAWGVQNGAFAKPADLLACLQAGHTYPMCLQFVANLLAKRTIDAWEKFKPTLADSDPRKAATLECRGVINPGFSAAEVPGANDDLNRVTAEQIVEWLLRQPAPPPGFSPGMWQALAPLICALGKDWGCAPSLGGGVGPIVPAPGGTGDYQ